MPGVVVTAMPWSVAAFRSTASKPTPARAMTRRAGLLSMTRRVYGSEPAMVAETPGSNWSSSASVSWPARGG